MNRQSFLYNAHAYNSWDSLLEVVTALIQTLPQRQRYEPLLLDSILTTLETLALGARKETLPFLINEMCYLHEIVPTTYARRQAILDLAIELLEKMDNFTDEKLHMALRLYHSLHSDDPSKIIIEEILEADLYGRNTASKPELKEIINGTTTF
jgi:hypothetical protein